jgi:hypothetical protein
MLSLSIGVRNCLLRFVHASKANTSIHGGQKTDSRYMRTSCACPI